MADQLAGMRAKSETCTGCIGRWALQEEEALPGSKVRVEGVCVML